MLLESKTYANFKLYMHTGKLNNNGDELQHINDFIKFSNPVTKKTSDIDYFINLSIEDKKNFNNEVSNISKYNNDTTPLLFQVMNSSLSPYNKNLVINKINAVKKMDSSEYLKLNNWIQTVLSIPWNIRSSLSITKKSSSKKIGNFLKNARDKMDSVVYGQNKTKDHIVQIITKMITNPSKTGNVFAIYGPPGTGKTTIIKEGMSKALGIPFEFISLGGATDSSYLDGHSYTYEGSSYGKIVDSLKKCRTMNPIFYFDELDKVSKTTKGDEIINLLIHLTDSSQNTIYQDKYLGGINIDLSQAIFVFSFNNINMINKILLDRMELILVEGFNNKEKMIICKNYILPELYKSYNIDTNRIIFDDDILNYIISFRDSSNEKGIRNVKRRLENIISKLNILLLMQTSISNIHTALDKLFELQIVRDYINNKKKSKAISITKEIVDILVNFKEESKPPYGMYT